MYLAQDTLLRRRVAIKFPRDPESVMDRLLQEARAASQLDHPNIARVLEAGTTDDGRLFVVMEYVEGETLAEALQRGPLPVGRTREVVSQTLDALEQAHRLHIVHRDIKPANIMLAAHGVKVLDFGLAKQTSVANAAGAAASSTTMTWAEPSTRSGVIMGTPAYMSPEQLAGEAVDMRSDLFACGVVLYECLTGRRPFEGKGPVLHGAILYQPPEPLPPSVSGQDPMLESVLAKALAKKPAARYQTAGEMAQAIRLTTPSRADSTMTATMPVKGISRKSWTGAGILAVVLGAGWWLTRPEASAPSAAAQRWHQQGIEALRDGTYYSAARALEQLTAADPGFALGHARLAEAWIELDSPEKAQRELLLARRNAGGWRRPAPVVELTLAAVEGLVLREYSAAADSYKKLLEELPAGERAGVWVDLGRAQQKFNDNAAALASYSQAIELDPTHAAAWLLRGVVQGARQQFAAAAADFRKAQGIYEASQNFEGQAELAYQQGRLAAMAKDLPAARTALERALDLATKSGDEFHQVRALTQLSIVTYMEGNGAAAQGLASRAAARARAARLPFLTVQALVDLGNAQLSSMDLKTAETTLREAVSLGVRDNLPRSEARARMSLGSVLVQAVRDEEAIPEITAAVGYYTKGQSRNEINIGRMLLGRVHRRRGEFGQVHQVLAETLRDATAAGDRGSVSDAVGEIANTYASEEKFVDALREYEKRFELVKNSKAVANVGYSLTGQAAMWMQLGDRERAKAKMEEAEQRGGGSESVARRVQILRREALYHDGEWAACERAYTDALLRMKHTVEEEMTAHGYKLACLIFAGKGPEARRYAATILPRARELRSSHPAMLLLAIAALVDADPKKAVELLSGPLAYFRKREQFQSLWIAEAIAAVASRRAGDMAQFEAHKLASAAAWTQLDARLGPEYRTRYGLLAPVRQYRKLINP